MKINRKIHPELNKYLVVVKVIAKMFGRKCEVLVHDFSSLKHSIIAIENGQVTGRKIGDPVTDFALLVWKNNGYGQKKKDLIINYNLSSRNL